MESESLMKINKNANFTVLLQYGWVNSNIDNYINKGDIV